MAPVAQEMKPPMENSTMIKQQSRPPAASSISASASTNSNGATNFYSNDSEKFAKPNRPVPKSRPDLLAATIPLTSRNFISRSQDNIAGGDAESQYPRKNSVPSAPNSKNLRPGSSLGLQQQKPGAENSTTTKKLHAAPATMKSKLTAANNQEKSDGIARSSQMRISKTKTTVTELQKQKQTLEVQVSDLVKNAEHKQAEIAQLKMELKRTQEQREKEVDQLKLEKQQLKKLLRDHAEHDPELLLQVDVNVPLTDSATSPMSPTRQEPLGASSSSDEGNGVESSDSCEIRMSNKDNKDWDRTSLCSQLSDMSLACLQDKIFQMEETHYSTNEELQATLQELTDLQDLVNELTQSNQQLNDERQVFMESLQEQTEKLEHSRMQIESLKHILLSDSAGGRRCIHEREQELLELLKNSQEEHNDLYLKYVEIRSAFEENQERQEMVTILKDRARLLENDVQTLTGDRRAFEDEISELKSQLTAAHREIHKLNNLYEKQQEKCAELQQLQENSGNTDAAVAKLRREKDKLAEKLTDLETMLEQRSHENEHLKTLLYNLQDDLASANQSASLTVATFESRCRQLDGEVEVTKKQMLELRAQLMDAESKCQRHVDDKKEYKANIVQLQKAIDDLAAQKDALRHELEEQTLIREQEQEEWHQFQKDLQIAVVVANDFKVEAQSDLEKLQEENGDLKRRMNALNAELERFKSAKCGGPNSTPILASKSAEIKSRTDGYLASVERTARRQSPTGASVAGVWPRSPSSVVLPDIAKCGTLNVRALVESLENSQPSPTTPAAAAAVNFRSPATNFVRSPVSARHSLGSSTPTNNGSADVLSKSSSNLSSGRPISLDSAEKLLKPAASDTEIRTGVPAPSRPKILDSAAKRSAILEEPADSPAATPKQPKGILVNKTPSTTPRKVYDSDNDPLAKLMKDAPRGSRRNALLKWCQAKTFGYKGVEVTNFSSSWNDGLAFCALIHSYLPDKVPIESLDNKDKRKNFTLAFEAAKALGIEETSLNVDEMVSQERPDWQSVMNYVTAIYKHFEGSQI